jgi:hypothetical protein
MTGSNEMKLNNVEIIELTEVNHPEWDEPIICRVEVDLPAWLSQLAGGKNWEVYGEDEAENCISFAMRQNSNLKANKLTPKLAEVTLYHAHLSYYHAESGEPITLN